MVSKQWSCLINIKDIIRQPLDAFRLKDPKVYEFRRSSCEKKTYKKASLSGSKDDDRALGTHYYYKKRWIRLQKTIR